MSGDVLLDTEHWFVSSILPGLDVAGLAHRGEGQAASDRRLVHCMQRVLEEHVMDIDPRTQAHRAATCKNLQAEIKSLQAQLGETQEAEEGEEEEEETELHSRELMAALRMQAASLKRHKQQRQWVKDGILHHMRVMREELAMTSSAEEEEEGEGGGEEDKGQDESAGCTLATIRALELEEEKLIELRKERIPVLIERERVLIRGLWDQLRLTSHQKLSYSFVFDSDARSDKTLRIHRHTSLQLSALFDSMRPLFERYDERIRKLSHLAKVHREVKPYLVQTRSKQYQHWSLTKKQLEMFDVSFVADLKTWEQVHGHGGKVKFMVYGESVCDEIEQYWRAKEAKETVSQSQKAERRNSSSMPPPPFHSSSTSSSSASTCGPAALARPHTPGKGQTQGSAKKGKSVAVPMYSPLPGSKKSSAKLAKSRQAISYRTTPRKSKSTPKKEIVATPQFAVSTSQQGMVAGPDNKSNQENIKPEPLVLFSPPMHTKQQSKLALLQHGLLGEEDVSFEDLLSLAVKGESAREREGGDAGALNGPQSPDDSLVDEVDEETIIIDHGASYIRAGFATDSEPRVKIKAPVFHQALLNLSGVRSGLPRTDNEQHWGKVVTAYSELELLLGVRFAEYKVLFCQQLQQPPAQRKMIREIFSKHFGQPPPQQLYVASVPVLLAYNYGLYTGILVDVGESSTRVTPMVDGYIVRDAIQTSTQLSGFNVTEILTQRLLQQQSNVFCLLTPSYMHSLAEKLKQQHAFVRTTTNVSDTFSCTLHVKLKKERKQIELSHELYQCAELFFSPTEVMQLSTSTADTGNGHQHAFPSLPQLILASLAACAIDDRRALLANICLSGSTTLLPHFAERLAAELKSELASQPSTRDAVRVRADPKRDHATWIGGNILSKQDQFRDKHWNLEGDTSPETDDFTMIMT